MAHHLALADHLTPEALFEHYRACSDPVERSRWQIIWLKSKQQTTSQIVAATGFTAGWVRTIIHRYNEHGISGLADRRHENPGAAPLLNEAQQAELDAALTTGKAPDGGLWNGPKVARWIEEATGREQVHDQRGWDYLLRLGFSAQTPRPRHAEADAAAQAAFKKSASGAGC